MLSELIAPQMAGLFIIAKKTGFVNPSSMLNKTTSWQSSLLLPSWQVPSLAWLTSVPCQRQLQMEELQKQRR
jgi:hypothetical protein